jgi:hypothetical protein
VPNADSAFIWIPEGRTAVTLISSGSVSIPPHAALRDRAIVKAHFLTLIIYVKRTSSSRLLDQAGSMRLIFTTRMISELIPMLG